MGATKECLYCVSEITDGFRFNGETDMRVWEKSLALSLCDAGASPVRIGAIVMELRFMIFLHHVSKRVGIKPGHTITNPEVIAFVERLFKEELTPEETAKRIKLNFPLFPWESGCQLPGSSSLDDHGDFSL